MSEPTASTACPMCGGTSIHPHSEGDVRTFASNQIARFGYRVELISPLAYVPVRDDVNPLLEELRSYAIDGASARGGKGRVIRRAIATIERLAKPKARPNPDHDPQ